METEAVRGSMRIFELRAENVKNLKVIEIRPPEDGAVILSGKNGAGKSAVLDSIFMTLTGQKLEEPIREGESRAEVNLDLGEYKVKKVFTPKGTRLEVTGADGASYPSPQALLDKIVGKLSFDPLAFAELGKTKAGEREQRAVLAKMVGLDFAELDKQRQELYDERTVRFREIKGMDPSKYSADPTKPLAIDALIGDMEKPAKDTPRVEISMEAGVTKVEALEKKAAAYASTKETNERNQRECDRMNQRIEDEKAQLRKQIEELGIRLKGLENTKPAEPEIAPLPEEVKPEQIAVARQELLDIDGKNKSIRAAIAYDKRVEQLQEAKAEIDRLTRGIDKIDREKKEAVASAKFPIEGLAIDDLRVTYGGHPLAQRSTGEQIRVSTSVAMALNPNLKVILIRGGSLLDDDAFAELVVMAKERDYQLWLEKVSSDKSVGIYIEDGSVLPKKTTYDPSQGAI